MERYLFISAAIIAILVFLYMRYSQKKRVDKRKQHLQKASNELMEVLKNKSEIKTNDSNQT